MDGSVYDVFISFRGIDTRSGFTGNLHRALHTKQIKSFMDDQDLEKGSEINLAIHNAIHSSRIALVILSKNYASSTFCLDELEKIMDCSKNKGMFVLPVFYEVDPSDVRYQKGKYADALNKHEARIIDEKEKIEKWRFALTQIANLSGWHFNSNRYEYELIENIVEDIIKKIHRLRDGEKKKTICNVDDKHVTKQELIKDQVANMYPWPKTLEDPTKAMTRSFGILHVKVLRAMKLKKKDLLGASNPYVKLKISDDKMPSKRTTVKHKNLNPEWKEEFNLVVKDPGSQVLEINVYDWEQVGKHGQMGMNVISLKDVPPEEPKELTLSLLKNMDPNDVQNEKSRGQIVVELTYKPLKEDELDKGFEETQTVQKAPEGTPAGGGLLVIIVHEAQDVEGKYHTNPYARFIFSGEEKKTKSFKKNRDPRWEEEFHFLLEEPPTNQSLYVEVISTSSINLFHQKESLGYIRISLADVVSNKRINEKYHLIDSKNGRIQVELQWRTS